jgi:hypothetical protein
MAASLKVVVHALHGWCISNARFSDCAAKHVVPLANSQVLSSGSVLITSCYNSMLYQLLLVTEVADAGSSLFAIECTQKIKRSAAALMNQ